MTLHSTINEATVLLKLKLKAKMFSCRISKQSDVQFLLKLSHISSNRYSFKFKYSPRSRMALIYKTDLQKMSHYKGSKFSNHKSSFGECLFEGLGAARVLRWARLRSMSGSLLVACLSLCWPPGVSGKESLF